MSGLIEKGSWVEIERILLHPGERAPQVPEDTRQVSLVMRVKGFLVEPGALDDMAEIETPTGRRLMGVLVEVNPRYCHSFGEPLPELTAIAGEVRSMLSGEEMADD
ncbi:MAG: 2-amino-4-oxopentanoate thiolase subunit OrtA [Candidatus Sedimenticola sp. 20ELBAFRAG]